MTDPAILTIPIRSRDPRLGRNIRHDPRSRLYAYRTEAAPLVSAKHELHIGILDQGQLGSCTGNATTYALASSPIFETLPAGTALNEDTAVSIYEQATREDDYPGQYPPDDTGSDGLTVAKVAKERGLISGYTHAFDQQTTLQALTKQPVIIGIPWYDGMFDPDANGVISISGSVAGGHEICLDEIDVDNELVGFPNSWGTGWGLEGRGKMTWTTLGALLANQGDATIFTPLSQPAPTPTPVPPLPSAYTQAEKDLAAAFRGHNWLSLHHIGENHRIQLAAKPWLAERPGL